MIDDNYSNEEKRFYRRLMRSVGLGALGLFALIFGLVGLTNVDATERAVVFHSDGSLSILEPGKFQWVTPILNDVTKYDVRDQTYTESAIGISLDLQETTTEVTVRYHIEEEAVQTLHQNLGRNYEKKVVVPAVQSCVKDSVSNFNVEDLTGAVRLRVNTDIGDCIESDLAEAGLVVDQISVTDFDFSPQFNQAIELRAIAQQAAFEEKNRLEQVKYQANQTIVTAQAQAEAARLLSQSTSGEQGAAYLYLEWLKVWNGVLPTVIGGDDSSLLITPPQPGANQA